MKKIKVLLLAVFVLGTLFGCASNTSNQEVLSEKKEVKLGVLKGPTGIGASYLLEKNSNDESMNHYEVNIVAEATDMVSLISSGSVDIAAVPTNLAASLYNKTDGEIKILALNTAGVLYILENGDSVNNFDDLKDKTIYAVGQGSNPEYVLNYLLSKNNLNVGEDVFIEFLDSAELTTRAASGEIGICMLPVPAVTTVMVKNNDMRIALNLSEEWDKLNNGSMLTMGCMVVRKDFYDNNKNAVEAFLSEYEESINYVKNNIQEAGMLCEKYEIVPNAAIASKAIPDANLIFVSGKDIRSNIQGYYEVLFDADPKSIGGKLPGEDFYIEN